MTVRELIKRLQELKCPNAEVILQGKLPEMQEPMPRIVRYAFEVSYWPIIGDGRRADEFKTIEPHTLFVKL